MREQVGIHTGVPRIFHLSMNPAPCFFCKHQNHHTMNFRNLDMKRCPASPASLYLLLFVVISSCGDSATPEAADHTFEPDTVGVKASIAGTERMSLLASEWKALTDSFQTHYRLVGGAPIGNTELEIPWSEIASNMPARNGKERGVLFHYGLDKGEFRLALSFVELTLEIGSSTHYDYPDHQTLRVHPVVNGKLEDRIPYAMWKKNFLYDPLPSTGHYFRTVEVRRTDGPNFEKVQLGKDPELELMPYEQEVLRLHDENDPKDTLYKLSIVVKCAAKHDDDLTSYAHNLCLHMRQRAVDPADTSVIDLLDESPRIEGAEFKMHGGDLGSLCPPLCKKYTERAAFQK